MSYTTLQRHALPVRDALRLHESHTCCVASDYHGRNTKYGVGAMRKTAWIIEFTMYLSEQCRQGKCPLSNSDDLPCPFDRSMSCYEADYFKWNQYLASGFRDLMKDMPLVNVKPERGEL